MTNITLHLHPDSFPTLPRELTLPRPGLVTVTGPPGSGKSRFLREILASQICLPLAIVRPNEPAEAKPEMTSDGLVKTFLIPSRFQSESFVADLLGLPAAVKEAVNGSYEIECPSCPAVISVFGSVDEWTRKVEEQFAGLDAEFRLTAADGLQADVIRRLGYREADDRTFLLDRFPVSDAVTSRLRENGALIWKFAGSILTVAASEKTARFARWGYCQQCKRILSKPRPFSASEVSDRERFANIRVGGIMLRELLLRPLGSLHDILLNRHFEFLSKVAVHAKVAGAEAITAGTAVPSLEPEESDGLRLTCLLCSEPDGTLILFEEPLSEAGRRRLTAVLPDLRARSTIVLEDRFGRFASDQQWSLGSVVEPAPLRQFTWPPEERDVTRVAVDCAAPLLPRVANLCDALLLTQPLLNRIGKSVESRTAFEEGELESRRAARVLCKTCGGAGVTPAQSSRTFRWKLQRCEKCSGSGVTEHGRFFVRSVPLEEILKGSVLRMIRVLGAAVPPLVDGVVTALDLGGLPLTHPLELLSDGERPRVQIARVLLESKRPLEIELLRASSVFSSESIELLRRVRPNTSIIVTEL